MTQWYKSQHRPHSGGILVLPTGGGKTFTAVRFICSTALSDGYKVLWLAHTHHLLEQAYRSFKDHMAAISEPKKDLRVRVVSGTIGHFKVQHIEPQDDVIIATLQTIAKANKKDQPNLKAFLESAKGKLMVVFDEAHHSPAPSYRRLILNLRETCDQMHLLGLTATPVYTDENLQGWLIKLFPQGILYQVTPNILMAEKILSKPIPEKVETEFTPTFDFQEYNKWIGSFRDIPEDIISQMADNRTRNAFIADHYVRNKEKYGKTIIFADRWYQCEAISEALRKKGVDTGTIYTHIDADPGSADARNKRKADENSQVLDAFRKNKLDVVLNVRMLTEGTDIPDVQSCFITRQTTSSILLTQMVGRALRGPKFGGTPEAYLVFFNDNWEQLINWAEYESLTIGLASDEDPEYGKRPPLQYISIELVRKLASQMNSGININPLPFTQMLPMGWYRVEYAARHQDTEDIENARRLVMVFESEYEGYNKLIDKLLPDGDPQFYSEECQFNDVSDRISKLQSDYFPAAGEHFGSNLSQDIFSIVRHITQNNKKPKFFEFEERERHDLDKVVEKLMDKPLTAIAEDQAVRFEYNKSDRYWQVLYPSMDRFKSQYSAAKDRIVALMRTSESISEDDIKNIIYEPVYVLPPDGEPSDDLKRQVKERDGRCLCCGAKGKHLQVDHIMPKYFGGTNILDNLQTLCKKCNMIKGIQRINFRDCQTDLSQPPDSLKILRDPANKPGTRPVTWERSLVRSINIFYQCSAVHRVKRIGSGSSNYSRRYNYNLEINLNAGNDPRWLEPHIEDLGSFFREAIENARNISPEKILITITAPDMPPIRYRWG